VCIRERPWIPLVHCPIGHALATHYEPVPCIAHGLKVRVYVGVCKVLCVPRIASTALTSRVARPALRP